MGRFLILLEVVRMEMTIMKKRRAVVRMVLFMKRTMQRRGVFAPEAHVG